MKAIINSPTDYRFKLKVIGPTMIKKMHILKSAEEEGQRIIDAARAEASSILQTALVEIDSKKKQLEIEIAELQIKRNLLRLEVAAGKQSISIPVKPTSKVDDIPSTPVLLSSRILPIINVEKMKEQAASLDPESRDKFVSASGLNIKAVEFKMS